MFFFSYDQKTNQLIDVCLPFICKSVSWHWTQVKIQLVNLNTKSIFVLFSYFKTDNTLTQMGEFQKCSLCFQMYFMFIVIIANQYQTAQKTVYC